MSLRTTRWLSLGLILLLCLCVRKRRLSVNELKDYISINSNVTATIKVNPCKYFWSSKDFCELL